MSSELVTCEVCPNEVPQADIKNYHSIRMCLSCYDKEIALKADMDKPENVAARVEAANPWNATLQKAKEIDQSINVRTDVFNAETVALIEIKGAIDNDANIPAEKKQLLYIQTIDTRISDFQKKIFELGEEMVKKQNELRSAVTMFNNEVIKLRAEEREQFKLKSPTYNPVPVKKISETKPRTPSAKKHDKSGIRTAAAVIQQFVADNKINLPFKIDESIVQMTCVSSNMTPDEAIAYYKEKFTPMIPKK